MQTMILANKGLYTSPNALGSVPEGSLAVADNIIILQDDLGEPRRGFRYSLGSFGAPSDRAKAAFLFNGKEIVQYGDSLCYFDGSNYVDYLGDYSGEMFSAEGNKNLYLTSDRGVLRIDDITQTPEEVGVPKAIQFEASNNAAAGGWLATDSACYYRVLWGIKDANQNQLLGAATTDLVLHKNTSGSAKNIDLAIYIPDGITASHFLQIHRSVEQTSVGAAVLPSTELALVYEGNPSPAEITAKLLTRTDKTPSDLRGGNFYANPSAGGIGLNNDRPPKAKVICNYKGYLLYGNTTSKHRFTLTLLGVGTGGLINNDTVVINDGTAYTFTAKTTPVGPNDFQLSSSGSAAIDVRNTAVALIKKINASAVGVYAYYISGPNDKPGAILLEERAIGGSAFMVTANNGNAWNPVAVSAGLPSENNQSVNTIFYSKQFQGEAVPLLNFFTVGAADKAILVMIPLRDSCMVFKEDGLFRVSTSSGQWSNELIDSTQQLVGPQTAVVLQNFIFALTTQGVCRITETGVQVASSPIESDIQRIFGRAFATIKSKAFAVAYETARLYLLWLPENEGDTVCSQAYVYNTFTNSWTRWTLPAHCGRVNPSTDLLLLGQNNTNRLYEERKTFSYEDYIDELTDISITAAAGKVLSVSNADLIEPGDLLEQSIDVYSFVLAVDTVAGTVTVQDDDIVWDLTSATIQKAIPTNIQWAVQTSSNPGALKQYSEATFLFQRMFNGDGVVTFSSDLSPGERSFPLKGSDPGLWGSAPWGEFPWGGENNKQPTRTLVPTQHQRCSQLTVGFSHRWAWADWQLAGLSLVWSPGSTKVSR